MIIIINNRIVLLLYINYGSEFNHGKIDAYENRMGIAYNRRDWLKNELSKANIKEIEEVFYAEIQSDGSLFIQKF